MNQKVILVGVVCLCVVNVAIAQNYYDEYQPARPAQHRLAPARLSSPANGPALNEKPTPVPILKQINRHNEDGSYTYGFEGADGSFKIETKAQTGEVKGKYGYVDETGKVRVVEYGADKYGFQPSGEGITVAPPTLVDESRLQDEEEEEQRRPQQQPTYITRQPGNIQPQRQLRPAPQQPRLQPQYEEYQQPPQHTTFEFRPQPQPQPQQPSRQQLIRTLAPQRPVNPPTSDVTYSREQRPPRPEPEYIQPRANFPSVASQQQQQNFEQHQLSRGYDVQEQQAPQQFSYEPAPAPQRPVTVPAALATNPQGHPQNNFPKGRSSVLDQLAKDYALPANGAAALTDVSFGFY